ncbi:MAG: zf-HC2 domain-containing protein [Pseudomonadota bacterium]
MLTCKELDEFLVDFLDGNLPLRTKLAMHLHLGLCKDCREYVRDYERAITLGRKACSTAEDEEVADVPEALVQTVLANLQSNSRS